MVLAVQAAPAQAVTPLSIHLYAPMIPLQRVPLGTVIPSGSTQECSA